MITSEGMLSTDLSQSFHNQFATSKVMISTLNNMNTMSRMLRLSSTPAVVIKAVLISAVSMVALTD